MLFPPRAPHTYITTASLYSTDRTACSHSMMHDTVLTALVYCSLLVVASKMDNDVSTRMPLPPCDVFLAPSTIPGGACMRTYKYKNNEMLCAVY